jgi:hypothetical protein
MVGDYRVGMAIVKGGTKGRGRSAFFWLKARWVPLFSVKEKNV